ncbi:CHC2 zinc finger domain-containing protein [Geitlerinema splendidum]|jgi:DNA primase|nr:CHC2 zinc finger domain-containing protein [Geitlerinema splendidum]
MSITELEEEHMIDTQHLKAHCDLRRLVEQDLGPAPLRGGRAYLWKCPFHHEHKGFSLAVWANGYRCFGACDTSGDALDWLTNYRLLSFVEALRVLGERVEDVVPVERKCLKSPSEPPEWDWQHRAERIVSQAEETLWSEAGEPALNYLTGRGLTTRTIRAARLGYVPGDFRSWRVMEGMDVPCGITIPWFAADALWAVKVRRAYGTPKYQQIRGSNVNGLYGADGLADREIALFCEGEFDTLLAQQEAGSLLTPVTLSSATAILSSRWYAELTHCHTILVAYDHDAAGEKGANRLLSLSPRFRAIELPAGKDITEFYLNGGDLYGWIEGVLQTRPIESPEVTP